MDESSVAEIIGLLQNESGSIDVQFQLWITITSAVIIASFAAGRHFSSWTKIFVALMYALASVTIGLRYANDASQFVYLKDQLVAKGVEYPAVVDLRFLRTIVYFCGTVATTAFIFLKQDLTTISD